MIRMSSIVWQQSSGNVGADCGPSPFSPTMSSPLWMEIVLCAKKCRSVSARSSGTETVPSYFRYASVSSTARSI